MASQHDKVYQASTYTEDAPEKPIFKDGDKALEFLRTQAEFGEGDSIDEKRLVRKIDFQIVPLMFCCYFLQYLDKSLRMKYRWLSLSSITNVFVQSTMPR